MRRGENVDQKAIALLIISTPRRREYLPMCNRYAQVAILFDDTGRKKKKKMLYSNIQVAVGTSRARIR